MSLSKDKSSSKFEVVTLDSSDDESSLFYNTPPQRKTKATQENRKIASVFSPVQIKESKKKRSTTTSTSALQLESKSVRTENPKKSKSSSSTSSSRVRVETSKKPVWKLPKHLPTDDGYVYTRKERVEVQGNSKVMSLSQHEKDALIAQRVNKVMGETMDQPKVTKLTSKRSGALEGSAAGVSTKLKAHVQKGAPLWNSAQTGNTGGGVSTKAPVEAMRDVHVEHATAEDLDWSSGDEAVMCISDSFLQNGVSSSLVIKGNKRSCSESPPRTPPPCSPGVVGTPMLDYSTIDTPVLKAELKRFGLKPFPRSKAKVLLRHIYKETHRPGRRKL